jgi:glutathione-S-conjugate glycine hydrolase
LEQGSPAGSWSDWNSKRWPPASTSRHGGGTRLKVKMAETDMVMPAVRAAIGIALCSLATVRAAIGIALCSLATAAQPQTLSLPDNLIDLRSHQGEQLLRESDAYEAFVPLSVNFVTQENQAFCGVASIVMVLNAMQLPAPAVPEYDPYHTFTQDNFLNERTEAILPRKVLAEQGMTLDQIGALLATQPVKVEIHHAADSTLDEFRKTARDYLSTEGRYVVVNYLRKAIGEEKGGHISPLAAYDAETDRFLILDVSRYKYPPVWVTASQLFDAMNTTDSDNQNKTRGFVLVTKADG